MSSFEYADKEVGQKEIALTVASMNIGVIVLTLPRIIAATTKSSDGWISLLAAGGITLVFAYIMARLVLKFNGKTFFQFSAKLASKPVAYLLTLVLGINFFLISAYEVRAIAAISKFYLFERTPVETIALVFLLVVIYAVSGSKVGIIRLNVLFLPIVLMVTGLVLALSTGLFEFDNLQPFFISSPTEMMNGMKEGIFSFLGFEVVLFYVHMMNRPKEVVKGVMYGIGIPIVLYLAVFIFAIGIFSRDGAIQIMYPTIEMAKEITIPGEFFERFESIFFVVWIMTIFNTACISMDLMIECTRSIFPKLKKRLCILVLSPLVYLICMVPQDTSEFFRYAKFMSYVQFTACVIIPVALLLLAKLRGGKRGSGLT